MNTCHKWTQSHTGWRWVSWLTSVSLSEIAAFIEAGIALPLVSSAGTMVRRGHLSDTAVPCRVSSNVHIGLLPHQLRCPGPGQAKEVRYNPPGHLWLHPHSPCLPRIITGVKRWELNLVILLLLFSSLQLDMDL